MERNEPTTAEIVAFLERLQTAIGSNRHSELWHYEQILSNARSRLEQLERENAKLTARAEKAEAERVLAVKTLTDYEDGLSDEKDEAYNRGYSDGYQDGTNGI